MEFLFLCRCCRVAELVDRCGERSGGAKPRYPLSHSHFLHFRQKHFVPFHTVPKAPVSCAYSSPWTTALQEHHLALPQPQVQGKLSRRCATAKGGSTGFNRSFNEQFYSRFEHDTGIALAGWMACLRTCVRAGVRACRSDKPQLSCPSSEHHLMRNKIINLLLLLLTSSLSPQRRRHGPPAQQLHNFSRHSFIRMAFRRRPKN